LRAVIVANGELKNPSEIQGFVDKSDIIIAANGGTGHCLEAGIKPSVVIGDLDSITEDQKEALESSQTKFIEYPIDKDKTDLELAINYAKELGINEIFLLGLFGGRLDQTIANLLLLSKNEWNNLQFTVLNGNEIAYLMLDHDSLTIDGEIGNVVSLIPLTQEVTEIYTDGLRWKLEGSLLMFGTTLGVSNEMINSLCNIRIGNGKLLVVHTRFHDFKVGSEE
jgi:thiamine pyrophosphokinase